VSRPRPQGLHGAGGSTRLNSDRRVKTKKEHHSMTTFSGLKLAQPILRAIDAEGYKHPSPIQAKAIPALLAERDLLGIAQTGTGKTAAFVLPLLHRLASTPGKARPKSTRALILAPTRELAGQIGDSLKAYGRHLHLRIATVFGGASIRPQIQVLNRGVHVLVATPGRLIDLMNQGHISLDAVDVFVLDEADRMLDMGFIPDVRRIATKLPDHRQTALFSATMPKSIQGLAASLLDDPERVEVAPAATTAEKVDQRVLYVAKDKKRALLGELMNDRDIERVLIFTRTKHGANRVARHLGESGIRADAIHGNKSQNARQRALDDFRNGRIRALVATDIAARGIDVDGVSHVINFELPNEPESYVHRIGRTARAGAAGVAISFCDHAERANLRDIEKTIRRAVTVIDDHPYHAPEIAEDDGDNSVPARNGSRRRRGPRQPERKGGASEVANQKKKTPAGRRRRRAQRRSPQKAA